MPPHPAFESLSASDEDAMSTTTSTTRAPTVPGSDKKSLRRKSSYQLAHPAGQVRPKRLRLKPRLLLQVQQVSQTKRPIPIIDVLPSTGFLPRFARRFPAVFRGKKCIGPNDLIIVTSESYERPLSSSADPHSSAHHDAHDAHREVIATICQLPQREDALRAATGKAEICLNRGPVWEATPLPNGSYEFVAQTVAGGTRKLRWVQRTARPSRRSSGAAADEGKRFIFSVIDPSTRRHPVIASMTRNHLDIYDEYSMPTQLLPMSPTSVISTASDSSENRFQSREPANLIETDDALRALIMVTSIWVAFREGWLHSFSYDDSVSSINSLCSPTRSKHLSWPSHAAREPEVASSSPSSPPSDERLDQLGDFRGIDSPSKNAHNVRRSQTFSPSASFKKASMPSGLSKRSNSTGSAMRSQQSIQCGNAVPPEAATTSESSRRQRARETAAVAPSANGDSASPSRQTPRQSRVHVSSHARGHTGSAAAVAAARTAPLPLASENGRGQDVSNGDKSCALGVADKHSEKQRKKHRLSNFFHAIFRKSG